MDAVRIKMKCGLGNRLRKMFSFLARADELGVPLLVEWPVDSACPGRFLDHFEPVPNVEFLPKHRQPCIEGWQPHGRFPENARWNYTHLVPRPHIREQAGRIVARAAANEYVGIHARRTDLMKTFQKKYHITSSEEFFLHIQTWYPNKALFLACDNQATQNLFKSRYGQRLAVQAPIQPVKAQRQTTLEAAVVDFYGCVAADYFVGTSLSSFSDIIANHHNWLDLAQRRALVCGEAPLR